MLKLIFNLSTEFNIYIISYADSARKSSVFNFIQKRSQTGRSYNSSRIYYFSLKLPTRILHSNVYKNICGNYFIFLHSEHIKEYLKRPGVYMVSKNHVLEFFLVTKSKTKKSACTLLQTLLRRPLVKKIRESKLYLSWNS